MLSKLIKIDKSIEGNSILIKIEYQIKSVLKITYE